MTVACAILLAAISSEGVGRLVAPPEWMPTDVPPRYIAYGTWANGARAGASVRRPTLESAAALCSLADGIAERQYAERCDEHGDAVVSNLARQIAGLANPPCWPDTRRFAYLDELQSMAGYLCGTFTHPWCSGWLHSIYDTYRTPCGISDRFTSSWSTVVEGTNDVEFSENDLSDLFKWPTYGLAHPPARADQPGWRFLAERWRAGFGDGTVTNAAMWRDFTFDWAWNELSNAHMRAGLIRSDADRAYIDIDPVMTDLGTNKWAECFASVHNLMTNGTRRIDMRAPGWMNHVVSQCQSWYDYGTSPGTYSNMYGEAYASRAYYADVALPAYAGTNYTIPTWHLVTNDVRSSCYHTGTCACPHIYIGETTGGFSGHDHYSTNIVVSFDREDLEAHLRDWFLDIMPVEYGYLAGTNYVAELTFVKLMDANAIEIRAIDIGGAFPYPEYAGDVYEEPYISEANKDHPFAFRLSPATLLPSLRIGGVLRVSTDARWSAPFAGNGTAFTNQHWAGTWNWANGYIDSAKIWGFDSRLYSTNYSSSLSFCPTNWSGLAWYRRDHADARMRTYTADSWFELVEGERTAQQNLLEEMMAAHGVNGTDVLASLVSRISGAGVSPPQVEVCVYNGAVVPRVVGGTEAARVLAIFEVRDTGGSVPQLSVREQYWQNDGDIEAWGFGPSTVWPITAGYGQGGIAAEFSTNWVTHAEGVAETRHRAAIIEYNGDWHNMKR